jgi:hypothetical protein
MRHISRSYALFDAQGRLRQVVRTAALPFDPQRPLVHEMPQLPDGAVAGHPEETAVVGVLQVRPP